MKVLITGASSGIGRDMARVLANKGYQLILVARNEKQLKELAEELREKNKIEVETIATDISNIENCKEIHRKVKNVDILINNAGFGDCGNFLKTLLKKEISMINTNIVAYHTLMKLYLIDMKEKGERKDTKCGFYCWFYARTFNGYLLCYKGLYCKNFRRN